MTPARRILRRVARNLTRPLRLAVNAHQQATLAQNIEYFDCMLAEAATLRREASEQLARAASRRMAIERGVA